MGKRRIIKLLLRNNIAQKDMTLVLFLISF